MEPFEVPAQWARFRSMDWGSAKPFSVGWWAIVSDDYYLPRAEGGPDRLLPRGALVRYREWYGAAAPNVGLKMTAEAVGAGIVERELNDPTLRYGVLDPACFKEDGGPSIAERINKELIAARLRPFHAADNSRVPHRGSMGGWDQLRSRLVGQDGRPMIYCFSTHAASIRTIPALSTTRRGPRMLTPSPRITPRTIPASRTGVDGRLGSAALPPSRPRWPAHDLMLQYAHCER